MAHETKSDLEELSQQGIGLKQSSESVSTRLSETREH
jgi:hypothetical protein